jgi:hypothetical protein
MSHITLLTAGALTGALTLTGSHTGEHRLTHTDTADSAWETAASVTYSTEVEESLLDIDGQEMEPALGMQRTAVYTVRAIDRIAAAEDGWATDFTREFVEAHRTSGADGVGDSGAVGEVQIAGLGDHESPFAEESVRFLWSGDEELYRLELPEDSGLEEEWLEGLSPRFDGSAWLPGDAVEIGDQWEVEPEAFRALFEPAGDMRWFAEEDAHGDDDDDSGFVRIEIPSVRAGFDLPELEGTLTVQLLEVEDGLATLELSADLLYEGDIYELLAEDGDLDVENVDRVFTLEGTGSVVWNLAHARLESLDLEADLTDRYEGEGYLNFGPQEVPMAVSQASSGTAVFAWSCAAVE